MKVSVITPVYNAAEFVTRAVESALVQPEVAEVLLIEDGSPDNSLEVCQGLAAKFEKVRLLRHPNGENRGAGASRNLGMQNATCEYIAFLDADDYYLPGRFQKTSQVFLENPDCEGVYEVAETLIINEVARKRFSLTGKNPDIKIISVKVKTEPEQLGINLIEGKHGYFHIDGFVLRSRVINRVGYMNEMLRLHQDTEWMVRCALLCKLFPGRLIDPITIVTIHDHNRFFAPQELKKEYHNRMKYWLSLYDWSMKKSNLEIQKKILNQVIFYTKSHKYFRKFPRDRFPARLVRMARLLRLFRYPEIIKDCFKYKVKISL